MECKFGLVVIVILAVIMFAQGYLLVRANKILKTNFDKMGCDEIDKIIENIP